MNILFTIQPAAAVTTLTTDRVTAEVNYLRSITDDDGTNDLVPSSARTELDAGLNGSILLEGVGTDQLEANVLSVDGSSLLKKVLRVTKEDTAEGTALLKLSAKDVVLIATGQQVIPTDTTPLTMVRTARLVPIGSVAVDYARSSVAVLPIADGAALTASGVDTLLKSGGARIASLEATGQNLSMLNSLAWHPTHLAVDGTFTASFKQQSTIGWLWWLIGDHQVVGFVPDNLNAADHKTLVIVLPALASPTHTNTATPEKDSGRGRSVPANVTEAEVANNPDIYTEDPGAFCRPFSDPERVVSEKSFEVIARVTQPEIGPLGSVKTKTIKLLNLDLAASNPVLSGGTASRLPLPTALDEAMIPARHPMVSSYLDLLKRLPSGRTNMDANHPLQWEDDIAQYQAATVAIGHILEFRVRWRSNGYSLGTVAKTLTLAPRQTKRIQKIEWERSERARRSERTQLRDQENDSIVRERDYNDSVAASLSEWASGGSSSSTEAIAAGIGFFAGSVLGGIGGGASSSNSTSHQEGGRDTTASEQQRLRDAIRRHGDALRKFESTVVNEVTQEETVTGTTEVLRNANYAHSLTVIYYQILRHLKVTTEFAGVRECIFVPFAIKPFDVQRAYRWREALQASIRSPLYSRALRYLKDVATNFTTSDIAPGPRAGQRLTFLRGSIYVSLGIERPRDTADGTFDVTLWLGAQSLLGSSAYGIFSALKATSEAQRDLTFQAEYAPTIAANWANEIRFQVGMGGPVLQADCTLASRYQFNRSVRIDFVVSSEELAGLTRQSLQQLSVSPIHGLSPGSVANLTRLTLTYSTDRYERSIEGRTGTNDLISPVNGNVGVATVLLPLDQWERVDEQLEIRRSVDQLIEHLNEHVEYYHKAIWWFMDRDRLMMLLDGFYVPNTNNVSIASVVDREPVGIIGNSLIYRVGAASFLGYGKVTTPAQLYNVYAQKEPVSDPLLISLPTDGLYAQTIMDECAALEEHYGNTDWVLNDKEPDLGTIDPSLLQSRRADQTTATTPTTFPGTIINLQNTPEAPAPSGLQGVLNAVTNPNAFRDMAGLAATQANALSALNTAANLATNFGNQAAALELAKMAQKERAAKVADQQLATTQRAVDKKQISPEEGQQHFNKILQEMHTPSAPSTPHQDPVLSNAILSAAGKPGSTIEATTPEGQVKVALANTPPTDANSADTPPTQPGVFDFIPDPSAWAITHGSDLINDETFDQSESTQTDLAFNEDEHLDIGKSMTGTIDAWALAGLIEGGAMIDEKITGNSIAAPVDDWEIVVPDLDIPGEPYHALRPLSHAHWHYIVPDPVFEDPVLKIRWTADRLRAALERGDAAALTFGQLVFIGGDYVESFEQLHKPFLYKNPMNIMSFVAQKDLLSFVMLDLVQNGHTGALDKYTDLKDLEKIAAGEMKTGGWLRIGQDIYDLLAAFESIRSVPFGPLHLMAQFMASKQMPLDWKLLDLQATWATSQTQNLATLAGLKIQERTFEILLTNGHFLDLALNNQKHFSPQNWAEFEAGYTQALSDLRFHLALPQLPAAPIPASVLARVGFHLHFLTDAFATGHIRTPRASLATAAGGLAAKVMHDIDNRLGLVVADGFGDTWKAYGDGYLHGPTDSNISAAHDDFAKLSPAALKAYDANYTQVLATVAEAVLLVHYEAQRLREKGSANQFPILDKARFSGPLVTFLGDNHAPSGPHFPAREDCVAMDPTDKIAYLRKHQPNPVAVGSKANTNLPPLFAQNLQLDTSKIYWRRSASFDLEQYVMVIAREHIYTFDVTDLYHLARIGQNNPLPGVPKEKILLDILGSSGLPGFL